MSRLIVKNLPKTITSDKLREIFAKKGAVTDVQLKFTKDGVFRHFGFIGYKSEKEAQSAIDYFNNICINSCRITVEHCADLGDPKKPKAWSKYATDSSLYSKLHPIADNENIAQERKKKSDSKTIDPELKRAIEKHKEDPLFIEYMEAHAPEKVILNLEDNVKTDKSKKNNDSGNGESDYEKTSEDENENSGDIASKRDISDLEYMKAKIVKGNKFHDDDHDLPEQKKQSSDTKLHVNFFTVKVRGLALKSKKKDVKQFFHPLKPKSIRIPLKVKGIAYVGFKTEKEQKKALMKHRTFFGGKRIMVTQYSKQNGTENDSTLSNKEAQWKNQEDHLKSEETIAESGRIFVRNLSYTVTEEDLENLFLKYGPLAETILPIDRVTRKTKGFAVVTFVIPEHASKAYSDLDGSIFQGRMLHLLPGKAKKSLEELMASEKLTFKQKKMLKLKAEAGSSHNWNTLFLGQNAIVDVLAEKYNTTKEKILESNDGHSAAVRLALGETQIVEQTKEFLLQNGVSLDAFNQVSPTRSKNTILVKNLPAKTTQSEIATLFRRYGELGRVLLPPSGITAIVEFLEPHEAKIAFNKLAYTKFKYLPLYLEWAPSNTFTTAFQAENASKVRDITSKEKTNEIIADVPEETKQENENELSDDEPEPDSTLFIKNLNFETREETIKEHFQKCGPIHYVMVALKKDPKQPGKSLSMGYGFIQFKHKASAEKALKLLQQSTLDGHSLELKRSNRTLSTEVATSRKKAKIGKQTSTKILVRNIPFQATQKEVEDLFKVFGELKAVRLPKKMAGTGNHRGFAFVDYLTKHDAKRAFKALCQSTHLYGRRLVLEWAAEEETVDDIRKRTAEQFLEGPANKNLKKGTISFEELSANKGTADDDM